MGFLRNRVTVVSCAFTAAGLAVGGCSSSGTQSAAGVTTATASSTPAPCTSTYLAMTVGHRSGTATVTQAMDLTNNGTTACVLDGYPGVNLVGNARGLSQYTWTLQWASLAHSPVTLEPGGTAHFTVVYLPAAAKTTGTATATATATGTAAAKASKSAAASSSVSTSPKASAKASPKASATAKATTTAKAGAKASATPSKNATTASAVEDIEVLDISITLPNTFSQDETAWDARLVLQDKVAHAQTYVTPIVPGAA